ncbi:MAG: hypothetical protein KDA92_11200 [Planctomycetales bacterium]|nr:hypothetical protein [Planctomycetales bacterium]MCA9170169.1 hypothetical protein [Planctomycetales bacterium]
MPTATDNESSFLWQLSPAAALQLCQQLEQHQWRRFRNWCVAPLIVLALLELGFELYQGSTGVDWDYCCWRLIKVESFLAIVAAVAVSGYLLLRAQRRRVFGEPNQTIRFTSRDIWFANQRVHLPLWTHQRRAEVELSDGRHELVVQLERRTRVNTQMVVTRRVYRFPIPKDAETRLDDVIRLIEQR